MSISVKTLDTSEELISDRFWDVYDPVDKPYYVVSCHKALHSAPMDNSEFYVKLCSTVTSSTIHPLPNCPEFVALCAQHFSTNERVITNSQGDRVLCKIEPQTLKETLNYSADFVSTSISFDEAEIIQVYKKITDEEKGCLYQKILLNPVENLIVPFSSELCVTAIVSAVTLLNQILGSDTLTEVNEAVMGILLYLDRPGTAPLRFDEYLSKEICFQLSQFDKIYHFRYQVYLYALIIRAKIGALALVDSETFEKWPPSLPFYHSWSYSKFIDLIILNLFRLFNPEVSRISIELREMLNPDLTGDWFLAKNFSLIRVFGFTGAPYVLPIFLTSSVFALEVMRQMILADKEHFTAPSLKRSSWIKYPLTLGNFVLKKEAALAVIEQIMRQFDFPQASSANYDPKHIISQRRQEHNRSQFQHTQLAIESQGGEANSFMYDQIWVSEPLRQIVEERDHMNFSQFSTVQKKEDQIPTKKRSKTDTAEMDAEEQDTSKKQKVAAETEVIDLDMIKEIVVSPTIIQEEVPVNITEGTTASPEQSNKPPLIPIMQYQRYSYATAKEGQFQNRQSLLEHYMEQRKESLEQKKLNELKDKSEGKVSLITARDSTTGSLSLAITDDEKASEIRLEMDQLSATDKIWFHKQASEVLYADLTRETLAHKNAMQRIAKLEAHLKQEKAFNKAWSTQVAYQQTELAAYKELPAGTEAQPGAKVTVVKPVKRRGKATNVVIDQTPSVVLVKLHEEIAELKDKAVEDNAKFLVLQEQKSALELEKGKLLQEVEQLKSNTEMNPWSPIDQITHNIADLTVHGVEIEGYKEKVSDLKEQVSDLEQQIEDLKAQDPREEEINKLKEENSKLSDKVYRLSQKATGVLPLEGAKHLLWDEVIADITAFRPQLMIAEEHNKALVAASNKCRVVEEKLINRPQETAQNAVNYLTRASSSELQILKVKHRTSTLVDARKVIQKYNLIKAVREKMSQIRKPLLAFKQAFLPLIGYGLPSFWNNEDILIAETDYKELLIQVRSDHSKFSDMVEGLKGATVVSKLRQDFEIPMLFREVKARLPVFTEGPLIELEVLMKEMSIASIPKDEEWKEVFRVGARVIVPVADQIAASSSGK